MTRSIALDGGLYGDVPWLWFGAGLLVDYVSMPTQTQKRWLYGSDVWYAPSGYLLTSWMDGNIRTIPKDWCNVQIVARQITATILPTYNIVGGYAQIYWRPDETTAWESLGTVTTNGTTTLAFPAHSYGSKCQLKVKLLSTVHTTTPIIEAVIVKYLERPPDSKFFTRTYELSVLAHERSGGVRVLSLAEQLTQLETLRNSAEPLTWTAWFGKTYTVHITKYSWTDVRERLNELADTGSILVSLELMEIT
jgi:hypothetical protein